VAYAVVEELKNILDLPPEDGANDVDLQRALDAGATWIDWFTGRTFGTTGTSTTPVARTYPATTTDVVSLVDLQSTAPVVEVDADGDRTFSLTLDPAQYQLEPLLGPPFDTLRAWPDPAGDTLAPIVFEPGQLVRITGIWGYTDSRGRLPAAVNEANLLLGARYYKRREAPFQVLQAPELEAFARIVHQDTDVMQLLYPLSRPGSPGAALAAAQAGQAGVWGAAWVMV